VLDLVEVGSTRLRIHPCEGRSKRAHRVSYELFVGPIPDGKMLHHICNIRLCVNYEHLEPVTHKENMFRSKGLLHYAPPTHCDEGHELTTENMYEYASSEGYPQRRCRTCHKAKRRRRYAMSGT